MCEKTLPRFSNIETDKGAPYFDLFNPQDDPIQKNEKQSRQTKKRSKKIKKDKSKKHKSRKCDARAQREKEEKEKLKELREKKKKICPLEDAIVKEAKYKAPKPLKWLIDDEERHRAERAKFYICPKNLVRVPSPTLIIGRDARNRVSKNIKWWHLMS